MRFFVMYDAHKKKIVDEFHIQTTTEHMNQTE